MDDPRATYVGTNGAHRRFVSALANAKALAFVLTEGDAEVLRRFLELAEGARAKSRDGSFALGKVGGRSTTTTVQMAILVTGTELDLITGAPGGFGAQALALVFRELHRAFENYVVELFDEIAIKERRILFSAKTLTHEQALSAPDGHALHRLVIEQRKSELTRMKFEDIEKAFGAFGLPLVAAHVGGSEGEQADVRQRLVVMEALRNVLEHNGGEINDEFLARVRDSPWPRGHRVVVTLTEFGDAASATQWAAEHLNRRAVIKFGI